MRGLYYEKLSLQNKGIKDTIVLQNEVLKITRLKFLLNK